MTPPCWEGKKKQEGIKIDSQGNHFLLAITLKYHEYLSLGFPDNTPESNQPTMREQLYEANMEKSTK